jgi:GntR family histidine utilization transcriptional repressor
MPSSLRNTRPVKGHKAKPAAQAKAKAKAAPEPAPQNLALYQQIKDFVAGKIQDGTWKSGDRLPSENDLVVQFGMSRMTVNRALRELVEQGRIKRIAGVGSFVADEKPQANLLQIVSLAEDIRRRGHDYRCEVITVERISASLEIASALGLSTGESVFHSVCVHLEDGVPMQLEDRYVSPRMVPAFAQQDFSREQPSDFLVRTVLFDQMEHVVDAVLPTREQAELLQMDPTQPCLLLTRRTWTRETPITIVRCLHPGTRYRLGSRFRTDGNAVTA